jgi:hypothetical protein
MSRYRVAVDVGRTFTDLIVHDEESGSVAVAKTASIPADPAAAMVAIFSAAREPGCVWRVVGAVSQRWALCRQRSYRNRRTRSAKKCLKGTFC